MVSEEEEDSAAAAKKLKKEEMIKKLLLMAEEKITRELNVRRSQSVQDQAEVQKRRSYYERRTMDLELDEDDFQQSMVLLDKRHHTMNQESMMHSVMSQS